MGIVPTEQHKSSLPRTSPSSSHRVYKDFPGKPTTATNLESALQKQQKEQENLSNGIYFKITKYVLGR